MNSFSSTYVRYPYIIGEIMTQVLVIRQKEVLFSYWRNKEAVDSGNNLILKTAQTLEHLFSPSSKLKFESERFFVKNQTYPPDVVQQFLVLDLMVKG